MSADEPRPNDAPGERPVEDVDRRQFFRNFSRDTIETAATVIGVASALRRETAVAAADLLGLRPDTGTGPREAVATAPKWYTDPYRIGPGLVSILDQRRLPAEAAEIECRSGEQVAAAIRDLAARGGPVVGQLAAQGMALAAEQSAGMKAYPRFLLLRGTADALRAARPDVASVSDAVDRCLAAWLAIREPSDGAGIAAAVRAVADAISDETSQALERLGRHGGDLVAQPQGRPLEVMTIDSTGPLSGGRYGSAMGVVMAIARAGRPVHVWAAETRPSHSGARVTSHELRASNVPCTVIADSAVGWLLRERRVDAVLTGADRIAANGDVANTAGTYQMAVLASLRGVPLYVCAPTVAFDASIPDGSSLAIVMRPATDLFGSFGDIGVSAEIDALVPLDDVTPAALVQAYVTEDGVRRGAIESPAQVGSSPG